MGTEQKAFVLFESSLRGLSVSASLRRNPPARSLRHNNGERYGLRRSAEIPGQHRQRDRPVRATEKGLARPLFGPVPIPQGKDRVVFGKRKQAVLSLLRLP